MTATREKISADTERKILIGAITSTEFLRGIVPVLADNLHLLQVPYIKTVASWCLEYWNQYEKAPGPSIEDIHATKIRTTRIAAKDAETIEDFLEDLSDQYEDEDEERGERYNAQYWLDEAEKYLDEQALRILADDVKAYLDSKQQDDARSLVSDYRQVIRPSSGAINPFADEALVDEAFEEAASPLFKLPGDLGRLLNQLLIRESFLGIMGVEKSGKTWTAMELGIQAAKAMCNVAFFSAGDQTKKQMIRRLATRLTGRNQKRSETGIVAIPVMDCLWNQKNSCDMRQRACDFGIEYEDKEGKKVRAKFGDEGYDDYEPCTHCLDNRELKWKWRGAHWWEEDKVLRLNSGHAKEAYSKFLEAYGDRWRLMTYNSMQLNKAIITADLERLRKDEDWVPDVIIIDYADIMGPEDVRVSDARQRINETWMAMETLRKEWHCLVITLTQANKGAYGDVDIGMMNVSEDKRKLAHVTAMLAINQTKQEKKDGVSRIGVVVARDMEFHEDKQVRVLQCLKKGRPLLGGTYFI